MRNMLCRLGLMGACCGAWCAHMLLRGLADRHLSARRAQSPSRRSSSSISRFTASSSALRSSSLRIMLGA